MNIVHNLPCQPWHWYYAGNFIILNNYTSPITIIWPLQWVQPKDNFINTNINIISCKKESYLQNRLNDIEYQVFGKGNKILVSTQWFRGV